MQGEWSYNPNNELQTYDAVSYTYDENGNTVQRVSGGETVNYLYDVQNQLTRVETDSGSIIATYSYDPFGRRLWKEVGTEKTYFAYAAEGLIGEFDASGHQTKSYGYRPGSTWTTDPLFMKDGVEYYFLSQRPPWDTRAVDRSEWCSRLVGEVQFLRQIHG